MKKAYKLSVVVLVYNTEEYLRECLDSLVNQTLDSIEIIIVNDSSPDNSHIIIEEYRSQYENIKVINQENSGGAIAGNKGMKIARGEYVTIMDSDDIVPLNAYEKLYKKAKETNSEIVIGKPNILIDGIQKEILYKKEREVWREERVIENINDFLDIFYDAFYWNKIFKKDLIFEHECFMPPGMLYADRPMVHKAFLYAKRIAIIEDVVYLWRKRGNQAVHKSISQMNSEVNNFRDRMESYHYQLRYFDYYGDANLTNEFLKRNIERIFFPINNLVESPRFREVFLEEVKPILSRIENVYENELGIIKNLYIYMILNDLEQELLSYLASKPQGKVIGEKGKYYWTLPYFRDKSLNIPDELFQIKELLEGFIKIDAFNIENNSINFEKIKIPLALNVHFAKLIVQSRFDVQDYKEYDLKHEGHNHFNITINLNDYDKNNIYDIYLLFNYDNKEGKYRISKKMFLNQNAEELPYQGERHNLYFTNNEKLSLKATNFNIEQLDVNQSTFSLKFNNLLNDEIELYLRNRKTREKIYFQKNSVDVYELHWKHFLDKYTTYDIHFNVFNQEYRMSVGSIMEFNSQTIKVDDCSVDIYQTKKGNVSLKTYTLISTLVTKLKKPFKKFV
ncbi:glycosyltransferase [Bacillus cereus]|nr:hypothetical protein KQ1_05272 [Bacillus cereus BAG3O-1]PFF89327.1 glycosyltransferase [Bacillus cereus]